MKRRPIIERILFLAAIMFLVSCSKGENESNDSPNDSKRVEQYAINVSSSINNADIFVYNTDGSYILLDLVTDKGCGVIHINSSVEKAPEEGVTFLIDEEGKPVMMSFPKGHFIFKNVTDSCFDFAYVDPADKIEYYRNIKIDDELIKKTTRATFDNPWNDAFESLYYDIVKRGWDEDNTKALKPYLIKVLCLTVGSLSAVGLTITVVTEAMKSMGKECLFTDVSGIVGIPLSEIIEFEGDMKITSNSKINISLSTLAYLISELMDKELEEMGRVDIKIGPNFNDEEWKIKLNPNPIEFSPDGGEYFVDVNIDSRVTWDIDDSKIDHSWCEVRKLDVQVFVNVKANTNEYDRTCELIVRPKYSKDISPVTLEIRQTGIVFNLHPDTLSFTQTGGSLGVAVITNENIKSWSVSSYPTWCKIEKVKDTFWVSAEKNEEEDRDDIITVTGITKGGMHVDRKLFVEQKFQRCPDDKHPHMIDLGLPSGIKWACCNIGATKPEDIGSLFAWGETETKESFNWNNYRYWSDLNGNGSMDNNELINIGNNISGTDYDAATANWGGSWRMPTTEEFVELMHNAHINVYSYDNKGRLVKGKNGNEILIPLNEDRSINYWTSILITTIDMHNPLGNNKASAIGFSYDWTVTSYGYRCYGFPIRPVSDK